MGLGDRSGPHELNLSPIDAIPAPTKKYPRRLAFVTLSSDEHYHRWSCASVVGNREASTEEGPFGDHFHHFKIYYINEPRLLADQEY